MEIDEEQLVDENALQPLWTWRGTGVNPGKQQTQVSEGRVRSRCSNGPLGLSRGGVLVGEEVFVVFSLSHTHPLALGGSLLHAAVSCVTAWLTRLPGVYEHSALR